MKLSDFVRDQRKRHAMTQLELAERAGVGIRFVRVLEAGHSATHIPANLGITRPTFP